MKKEKNGESNILQIGTVEKGVEASANITGDSPNQVLNLILPKGDKGDKGDTGKKGDTGYTPIKGTDYFTNEEIQQIKSDILADVSSFDLEVVTTLPTENIKEKTIYLVPNSKQSENNIYDEYIYINNNWEIVGSTAIDPENLKDSIPLGAIIEYDGDTVPEGYKEVEDEGEVYSTEEVRIGTWIDGKPLYRKVIVVTGIQASGAKSVVHNISNLGNVINISGSVILNYDTGNFKRKVPLSQLPASWNTFINIGETAVIINRTTSGSELDIIIQIVLEYTKTTD